MHTTESMSTLRSNIIISVMTFIDCDNNSHDEYYEYSSSDKICICWLSYLVSGAVLASGLLKRNKMVQLHVYTRYTTR